MTPPAIGPATFFFLAAATGGPGLDGEEVGDEGDPVFESGAEEDVATEDDPPLELLAPVLELGPAADAE
jgi:hypothetical protein